MLAGERKSEALHPQSIADCSSAIYSDALGVTSALEGRGEEDARKLDGLFAIDHAAAEAEDVGVVVPARHLGGKGVRQHCGAYAALLVGGDAHPDARSAAEDAQLGASRRDFVADGLGVNRVVYRFLGICADVFVFDAACFQIGGNGVFNCQPAMVASQNNHFAESPLLSLSSLSRSGCGLRR